jgi:Raf kinase inhibitor-like YbhB/YbcL family protein
MPLHIADLRLTSPAFEHLGRMDERYTQYGANVQPPLAIDGVPDGTVELAVVCHDPDAPRPHGFCHWTLYGIPADTTALAEGRADDAFRPGPTDKGVDGYVGPRPPAGHGDHHYYFWVFALDRTVEGTPDRLAFLDGYADAIIEQNRLVGVYRQDEGAGHRL